MILEILGIAPDADRTKVGLLSCQNAIPTVRGMRGAPTAIAPTPAMATLAATCQGAATLYKLDDSTRFFAGTPTKLYEAASSVWTDVSRSAAYTLNSTQRWRFAQFGNVSLASNGADTIQASVSTGAFSCVAGAPVAAIVETVGAFVFAANISGTANQIQWAGINGYTNWTSSIATQAGSDTLTATSGPITAVRRFGTSIVVYKKKSMFLGYYVGPPSVWTINANQIVGNVGAVSQESVVNIGTPENPKHIFMGEDDFYIFDGSKPVPIGNNRIRETIFPVLDQSKYYLSAAVHDKRRSVVYFCFVSGGSKLNANVAYNYRTDKWGIGGLGYTTTVNIPFEYIAPGITYDSLGGSYTTYADLPNIPYDSAFLNSAQSIPALFDGSNNLLILNGACGSSTLLTGSFGDDVKMLDVNRIRPRFLTNPTTAIWQHIVSDNPSSISLQPSVSIASHTFDLNYEGRWHSGYMDMTGDWELADISVEGTESSLE